MKVKVDMYLKILVILTLFCAVYSDDAFLNETIHIRVKRGKYYSSPPQRFYRRPPITYPTKGAFSYTPPPGYMMDDEEPPYPASRSKVSRRPNEGLGDEDISNIVKYLSKQDLDKIIEFAGEKDRIRDNLIERRPFKREESQIVRANVQDYSDQFSQNGPYRTTETDQKFNLNGPYRSQEPEPQYSQDFRGDDQRYTPYRPQSNPNQQFPGPYKSQENEQKVFKGPYAPTEDAFNYVEDATQSKLIYVNANNGYSNAPLQTEESMQNKQISYLNTYIHHEINDMTPGSGPANIFTDSKVMKEEVLPKPLNLREDDYDISYTNNVPTVVKNPGYETKNFGDLPLMSNNYKLDTVSSYKVPHYTVTSSSKYSAPPPPAPSSSSSYSLSSSAAASSLNVPLEPAPPVSEAKEQSDAHLKAIKIWTHRSKGTAYTLHNDGTLSLERPGRPKIKYGP